MVKKLKGVGVKNDHLFIVVVVVYICTLAVHNSVKSGSEKLARTDKSTLICFKLLLVFS